MCSSDLAAMPQCGGEHVFSYRAMGSTGSFICTWMIVLGYVSVACFEACAFPTIITYLWPGFLKGYMYTVAGFDIYASWLITAIVIAFLIMLINIIGAKTAAILQTVLTCIIGGAGILLIVASVINGTVDNLDGQIFAGTTTGVNIKAIIGVAAMSPFYFIGFDVIPQAAEEINVPPKKIGNILILSVVLAVIFYAFVIIAVGFVMNPGDIIASQEATGLRTAAYNEALAYTRGVKPEDLSTDYSKVIPIGRDGKLDEVGSLVAYLVSDQASYITGTTVNISGGKSRG